MIDLAKLLVSTFIITLSGAMMPGPLLTVSISETVRRGRRHALLLIAGHALAELVPVAAFVLGISALLSQDRVIRIIGLAGGAFLLFMGFSILRAVLLKHISLDLEDTGVALRYGAVAQGALVSFANPYFTLWWMTIGAALIADALKLGVAGLIVFYVAHELSDLAWYAAVTSVVSGGRRFISDKVYRGVLGICGAFLVFLALSYLVPSARFFLRL